MTETRVLLIAGALMFALSFVAAFALMSAGASPLVTIMGGTITGVAAYVAVCVFYKDVPREVPIEVIDEADSP